MNRTEKENLVASMQQNFQEASLVVVTHYSGMTVAEMTDLRRKMYAAGGNFKVTQNRLTKLALKDTDYESLSDHFSGPTAIGYSEDPVAAAKVVYDYAKGNDKLIILGGSLGTQLLDAEGVAALAKLPSLDEVRAKILGMVTTPATRVATVAQAPAAKLARVFGAYARKDAA